MTSSKTYVVFVGRNPGIYNNWDDCESQVKGFKGAMFKGFKTYPEAKNAYDKFTRKFHAMGDALINYKRPNVGICSDASYLVKKNLLEYRVMDIKTKEVISHGIFENAESKYLTNIGEFFGLVRAVKYVIDNKLEIPIYSDSVTAIKWVSEKSVKTKCNDNRFLPKIEAGLEYIKAIELPPIAKWQTNIWGEIPADFGRK